MMALSAFSYSNIFFMFQNLFLSVSNAETLYYFYYFLAYDSLFLPTTSTFFGRVVYALGP